MNLPRRDALALARRIPAVARQLAAGPAVAPAVPADDLEAKFLRRWQDAGGPPLERQWRFDPVRKWRFDFAHPASRVAVECDGGIWTRGRHTRPQGFVNDATKLNYAAAAGWRVFRVTPAHLNDGATVAMILAAVRAGRTEIQPEKR